MANKVQYMQLDQQIKKIDSVQGRLRTTLQSADALINECVNSGTGTFDSEAGKVFKKNWDLFQANFKNYEAIYKTKMEMINAAITTTMQGDEGAHTAITRTIQQKL